MAWLMGHIPFRLGQLMGKMLGTIIGMVPVGRLAISLDNIQKAFGISRAEAMKINRRMLLHFGQMLFEVPHILRVTPQNLHRYVSFSHEENLIRAMEKGRGVFILTGHFGNWELMSVSMAITFDPGAVVVRPIDFGPLDRFMDDLRSRFGTEIIPKQRGMRRLMGALRRKRLVGILLDQNVDWYEGIFVKFFHQWACTNKGLALLALKTGAPVIPTFSVRQRDGRYKIIFEKEVELVRTGDKIGDVEENTALYTSIIEEYIKKHPDHWFWFHRRWKTRNSCVLPESLN